MPTWDYKCDECGFTKEYCTSYSVPKEMRPPDKCPECEKGTMEKQWTATGQSFDIVGFCYMNEHGKHAWKKRTTLEQQAQILAGEKDPY